MALLLVVVAGPLMLNLLCVIAPSSSGWFFHALACVALLLAVMAGSFML